MRDHGSFGDGGPADWPFEPFPESALQGSIGDRFQAIARRHSDRLAVSDPVCSLTYSELATLSDRIAAATVAATSGRLGPVAILLRNEARFAAAMLGVLAAGRACIPLDSGHPIERNRVIATHAKVDALISAGDLADDLRSLFPPDLPIIDIDALGDAPCARPSCQSDPAAVAYIVYTSGSTGAPKGVYHSHRNCLHDMLLFTNVMSLSCEDRLSLHYSPSVIGGLRNMFAALLNGASLHVLPPLDLQPVGLAREIRARGITLCSAVPSLFRHLAEALAPGECFDTVRVVRFGGDRVDWSDFDGFQRICPARAKMVVSLGSSECSSHFTEWVVDEALRASSPRLPVGRTVADLTLTIVDDSGAPVSDGEVGEFVVASRYVALGYWQEPELTAQAFKTDPHNPDVRIFATGDLGRRRPDRLYEYAGRKNEQIKLHGNRIEPGEIESALRSCTGVRDAAVIVRRDERDHPQSLMAYAELYRDISGLLPRHLMSMLAQRLPGPMMPSSVILVDELPRLPSLKIDRLQLADTDARRASEPSDRSDDPWVNQIIAVFKRTLDCDATPDDNVLSLGGDSLHAVKIAFDLEKHFAIQIPIDEFESTRTIRDLAIWIKARHRDQVRSAPNS